MRCRWECGLKDYGLRGNWDMNLLTNVFVLWKGCAMWNSPAIGDYPWWCCRRTKRLSPPQRILPVKQQLPCATRLPYTTAEQVSGVTGTACCITRISGDGGSI